MKMDETEVALRNDLRAVLETFTVQYCLEFTQGSAIHYSLLLFVNRLGEQLFHIHSFILIITILDLLNRLPCRPYAVLIHTCPH